MKVPPMGTNDGSQALDSTGAVMIPAGRRRRESPSARSEETLGRAVRDGGAGTFPVRTRPSRGGPVE
jgi:hypothetical protein